MWHWRKKMIERNNKIGPIATIALNVGTWFCCYLVVVALYRILFHMHWLKSRDLLDTKDGVCAVITGLVVGLLEWADRSKKRQIEERKRQGLDATMM